MPACQKHQFFSSLEVVGDDVETWQRSQKMRALKNHLTVVSRRLQGDPRRSTDKWRRFHILAATGYVRGLGFWIGHWLRFVRTFFPKSLFFGFSDRHVVFVLVAAVPLANTGVAHGSARKAGFACQSTLALAAVGRPSGAHQKRPCSAPYTGSDKAARRFIFVGEQIARAGILKATWQLDTEVSHRDFLRMNFPAQSAGFTHYMQGASNRFVRYILSVL
jgi:hypothetical protein